VKECLEGTHDRAGIGSSSTSSRFIGNRRKLCDLSVCSPLR
jgi:hypothetical protein